MCYNIKLATNCFCDSHILLIGFFLNFCSDYEPSNSTLNVNDPNWPGAKAGAGVLKAVWQLILAMIFKAVITVFTFGIKVRKSRKLFHKVNLEKPLYDSYYECIEWYNSKEKLSSADSILRTAL